MLLAYKTGVIRARKVQAGRDPRLAASPSLSRRMALGFFPHFSSPSMQRSDRAIGLQPFRRNHRRVNLVLDFDMIETGARTTLRNIWSGTGLRLMVS